MTADYRVEVYKRDSPFDSTGRVVDHAPERESETTATDWKHCLTVVRLLARAHPDRIVAAYNADTCDCDDGLTDGEREAVFKAVEEARR